MSTTGNLSVSAQPMIHAGFDVTRIREDFPILHQKVHGQPLVYLDNAATTQKPSSVIAAMSDFYARDYSNIHRGVHALSERSTEAYEQTRSKVQRFLNARDSREIVFVRGATEGINLVAHGYGRQHAGAGDEVLITGIEHHANIVPWQMICLEKGAKLRVAPVNDRGEVIIEEFEKLLSPRTKIAAITQVSNALGTINPVKEMIAMAHRRGIPVLVDGAQGVPHLPVDVQDLDCDFYAFSGHKMYGPTGIGVLYGKASILESMTPYQGGGDMIRSVTFEKTTYNDIPYRFEAGTPNIAGTIGLGAAIDYISGIGLEKIAAHEHDLLVYGTDLITEIPGVRIIGTAAKKAAVISFVMDGIHPHDVGTILDRQGVAIRAGHHCAQPVMDRFGVPATSRASFALYNTMEEVDRLAAAIRKAKEIFS